MVSSIPTGTVQVSLIVEHNSTASWGRWKVLESIGTEATVPVLTDHSKPVRSPLSSPWIFHNVVSIHIIPNDHNCVVNISERLTKAWWTSRVNSWFVSLESEITINQCCDRSVSNQLFHFGLRVVFGGYESRNVWITSKHDSLVGFTYSWSSWVKCPGIVECNVWKFLLSGDSVDSSQFTWKVYIPTDACWFVVLFLHILCEFCCTLQQVLFRQIILLFSFEHHPALISTYSCEWPAASTWPLALDWTHISWNTVVNICWQSSPDFSQAFDLLDWNCCGCNGFRCELHSDKFLIKQKLRFLSVSDLSIHCQ